MVKLDLGCGVIENDGYVGVDVVDLGQDYVCDFEHEPLPFKDNEVDEIWMNHCLEHIKEPQNVMNEAWRVLKKDGVFRITVPYGLWEGAQKPVHYQCMTLSWFDFFRKPDIEKRYGYKRWRFGNHEERLSKHGEKYEIYIELIPEEK